MKVLRCHYDGKFLGYLDTQTRDLEFITFCGDCAKNIVMPEKPVLPTVAEETKRPKEAE